MAEKAKVKTGPISIDFTGVESTGGRPRIPEDDYGLKIVSVKTKQGDKAPYFQFGMKVIKGQAKGLNKILIHRCSLSKDALWNLRNLLEACGKNVPSKSVKIDPQKLVGLECGGTVIDEEYDGKKHSIISAFFPMSDLVSDTTGKSKKKDEEQEEDEAEEGAEVAEETTEEPTDEEEELFT